MKEKEYQVNGFSFPDTWEYNEAKQEAEAVEYLRATADLTDPQKVLKLYHRLVEKKILRSIFGYEFLKELQDKILEQGIVKQEDLPGIPIEMKQKLVRDNTRTQEQIQEDKYKKLSEEYRIRHRNSRIINIFLVVIIFAMFIISFISNHSIAKSAEEKVINKYSSWEEELQARENTLNNTKNNQ
ncbi:MAG TPA: hypothetical protein VN258_19255 [Mobilitalea sp.]|nr:hypothetical protein [Mobilitalea sp.]